MDGNNRWSKKNNKNSYEAYSSGAKKLLALSSYIFDNYKINYISAFALSKKNLKRSSAIIKSLKRVLEYFLDQQNNLPNRNFQICFKGDFSFLDKKSIDKIYSLENNNPKSKKKLIIYINYSGKDDIINSFNNYLQTNPNKRITDLRIKENLYSKEIPDPDILIRTGGYKRISDFMLYQISFTELMFTKKLWPDLSNKDLDRFIKNYYEIERKFGV
jgi:undecaprenyl diphosphate synthase